MSLNWRSLSVHRRVGARSRQLWQCCCITCVTSRTHRLWKSRSPRPARYSGTCGRSAAAPSSGGQLLVFSHFSPIIYIQFTQTVSCGSPVALDTDSAKFSVRLCAVVAGNSCEPSPRPRADNRWEHKACITRRARPHRRRGGGMGYD